MDMGCGDPVKGVKILLRRLIRGNVSKYYNSANTFIEKYLSEGDNDDRMLVKDLYKEYCEFTKYQLGKKAFNKLLGFNGFMVKTGTGNKMTVFNIKSNWI